MVWVRGLLCVLCLCSSVFALDPGKAITQYINDVWQMEQGMPQNSAQAIVQTPDGYIWLGTQQGLVRFDGVTFTNFNKDNTPGFGNNVIWALYVSRDGTLWIGTYGGGIIRYRDGKFQTFGAREGLSNELVRVVYEDSHKNLWVGTRGGGLNRFHNGKFTAITTRDGLSNDIIRAIAEDHEGNLWVGTDSGLNRIRDGKIQVYRVADGLTNDVVWAIHETPDHRLWFGTQGGGLNVLENEKFSAYTQKDGLPSDTINCILQDNHGALWIGTYGDGISRFHNGKFTNYAARDGLSNNVIWALYSDPDGSLWVGTESGGLNRLKDGKFITYTSREGLSSDVAFTIFEDSTGSLWVGTSGGGLNRFQNGQFKSFGPKDGLNNLNIFALTEDREGAIWIGTRGSGLYRYKDGTFTNYGIREGLTNDTVYALSAGRDGSIWIGTFGGGLVRMKDGKFTSYTMKDGLSNDAIFALLEDRKGNLWIGTYGGGLNVIRNGKIQVYSVRDGLSNNSIFCLHEDAAGVLWIGTYGGGINRFENGIFRSFTTRDGLFNDVISQIVEDDLGNFWVSCNRGIFRIRKKDFDLFSAGAIRKIPIAAYGKEDGMKSSECYGGAQPAGWRSRDGSIWFPTSIGIVKMNPKNISRNENPPNIRIEQMAMEGLFIQADTGATAEIPPGKEKFEFHYTAFSYMAPQKILFKYKLEGFDQNWISAGTRRVAFYTAVPPGNYTFRVIASNEDGVWNEKGASFRFFLRPRFYQTYWFYTLSVLFLGLLASAAYRFRVNRLKEREQELLQVVAERTRNLVLEKEKADQTVREIGTLERIVQVINREVDMDRLLKSLLDQALVLFPQAEKGAFLIFDNATRVFRFTAMHGYDEESKDVTFSEEEIMERYTEGTEKWDDGIFVVRNPGRLTGDEKLKNVSQAKCLLAVSIVADGKLEGFLVLNNGSDPHAFSRSEIGKVKRFREHAVTAVARARVLQELHDKHREAERQKEIAQGAMMAAEEASRAKSSFLANMSHELRTPLNAIIGYSEMLQEEAQELQQDEFVPDLKKIKIAGKHLLALINDILDLSKIEAGKMDLNLETFPLASLLEDVQATISPLADKNSNRMTIEAAPQVGEMRSDMIRVRQILFNLLSNACKFTSDGTVLLRVQRFHDAGRDWISFEVRDSGIGMTPEQVSRLFQAFTQADASTSRKFGGTGLGLVLSRRFAQMLGGDIVVESEPGKGTTFTARLPAVLANTRDAFELNRELLQSEL